VTRRILLVRHARPEANWHEHPDSPLDATGRAQAVALADDLAETWLAGTGPRPLVCSPTRRTRETTAPLAARWGLEPVVVPAVGEIPSPTEAVEARGVWLREVLRGTWADVDDRVASWRRELLAALLALEDGTVVVSHFVAINAAVGAATGNDRIITFTPDHCSRTRLGVEGDRLTLLELGRERATEVR
jgi:broad specificity phosphatase PhoE